VTNAVFHAPMFALNAAARANACEPSHTRSTTTERAHTGFGADAWAPKHTRWCARAHTRTTRGRVSGACAHAGDAATCTPKPIYFTRNYDLYKGHVSGYLRRGTYARTYTCTHTQALMATQRARTSFMHIR
jgi:hypothetical protein